jgi:hypothetical protein
MPFLKCITLLMEEERKNRDQQKGYEQLLDKKRTRVQINPPTMQNVELVIFVLSLQNK